MNSIVLELQKDAMDPNIEISDLLRKAYIVAKKLKIKELENWIKLELNGYNSEEVTIPKYRKVHGSLKYFNPFYGYSDFVIEDSKLQETASTRYLNSPLAEIEDLYKKSKNIVVINIESDAMAIFRKYFNSNVVPEKIHVSVSQLKSILDSVRNIILEWSLKLEEDGILGEDLEFTSTEKEIAVDKRTNYSTIIYGSIIQVGDKNIQNINQIDLEEVETQLKSIKEHLGKLELNNDVDKKELKVGIKTIESQLESQKPNQTMIKESFKSIRNILEGCASSAIAPILIAGITKLIGL